MFGQANQLIRVLGVIFSTLLLLAPAWGQAPTRAQFEQLRKKMVDEVVVGGGVKDPRVIQAMLATPRHEFVAAEHRRNAYFDMALPIGGQQTISSPFIVSYMTESLQPKATDKVLEIGSGSGYQAAVLSPLVKEVYTIEIVESLGKGAERVLKRLGYDNVHVKVGDGYQGWPEHAPFDKIIVTCSPEKAPQPLVEQLREGGLMVVPVGERYTQTLYLFRKKEGKLEAEALLPTLFVPMTGKAEDIRAVKPDPANPTLVNGDFEEPGLPNNAQTGWYYERRLSWESSSDSPSGKHHIKFENSKTGLSAHLLQGFSLDGRLVKEAEFSGWVATEGVVQGNTRDELPSITVTLYDAQRRTLGHQVLGPFLGDGNWREVKKTIRVPLETREALFRIGLFGATGVARFDKLAVKRVEGK
jgi:protein-L-isoaspartate(D-aspartate) O-methyltransferase